MKFVNNKKLTLPLIILGLVVTACLDNIDNKQVDPPKQEHKTDSTMIRAQIVQAKVGYYLQE